MLYSIKQSRNLRFAIGRKLATLRAVEVIHGVAWALPEEVFDPKQLDAIQKNAITELGKIINDEL